MTLRRKTLLTIGWTLGLLVVTAYALGSWIFLERFAEQETSQVHAAVQRAQHAINGQLERIESTARAYAMRDDSFNFIAGSEPYYAQKYLNEDMFRNYDINAIVFMPLHGEAVFAKSLDLNTLQETALAGRITVLMTRDSGLRYSADAVEGKSGVLRVGTNFFMFAVQPILSGTKNAPSNGTLLMARALDQDLLNRFNEQTSLNLTIQGVAGDLPEDFAIAWEELRHGASGPFLGVIDDGSYAAYVPMLDQSRKPVALLRVTPNHDNFAQARSAIYQMLTALLALGLICVVIILVSLERLVLGRLLRLTEEMSQICTAGNLNARVSVSGHDELGALAQKINQLLKNLSSQVELQHTVASAQTAAVEKSTFLANMSHELRTPLNAIIGYSELLRESAADDGYLRLMPDLQKIVEAGKHLQSGISNVLDISEIEAGKMDLENLPFDLREAINAVSDQVLVSAREKALRLLINVGKEVPRHITGDARRMQQILINLMSNAVKFTEQGEVELSVAAKYLDQPLPAAQPAWELNFSVRDTGIGIPAHRFERLFRAFSQIDTSSSRRSGGTGLGLAISQQLCLMMGGHMWVESSEGTGSTFYFMVRAQEAAAIPDKPALRASC